MEELDLMQFAQLFDKAISSDVPAVKTALKNLMMVSALSDNADHRGPLSTLISNIESLEKRVQKLEYYNSLNQPYGSKSSIYSGGYSNKPTF